MVLMDTVYYHYHDFRLQVNFFIYIETFVISSTNLRMESWEIAAN